MEAQDNPNVLFVSSGRSGGVGDVVKNQGESLKQAGLSLEYFIIKSGLFGYLAAIPRLRRKFKSGDYNIVHAHYSYSGIVATLAGCRPLVVSFMGSDTYMSKFLRLIAGSLIRKKWDAVIVKTAEMKESLAISDAFVIPNGVDLKRFRPIPRDVARQHLGYDGVKNLIILIAVKGRKEKNVDLAYEAVKYLNKESIEFRHIYNVPNSEIPYWLNAADVMLLTSKREGSVNVIKEAMVCNCPIVATDVGDIRWLFGDDSGHFLTRLEPRDVAEKLEQALLFAEKYGKTNGRERLMTLGLDSVTVARKIKKLYIEIKN